MTLPSRSSRRKKANMYALVAFHMVYPLRLCIVEHIAICVLETSMKGQIICCLWIFLHGRISSFFCLRFFAIEFRLFFYFCFFIYTFVIFIFLVYFRI